MKDNAFNKSADYCEPWIRKALPCNDEFFSVSTENIPFPEGKKLGFLDLGADTGLFSWHLLQRYQEQVGWASPTNK